VARVCESSFLSNKYKGEHILEAQYLKREVKFMRIERCSFVTVNSRSSSK
jgi:hypothetical protein